MFPSIMEKVHRVLFNNYLTYCDRRTKGVYNDAEHLSKKTENFKMSFASNHTASVSKRYNKKHVFVAMSIARV